MTPDVETVAPSATWAAWQALTEDGKESAFARFLAYDNKIPAMYTELTDAEKTAWMGQMPPAYLLHVMAIITRELARRLELPE